jgi:hypothetical protein
MNDWYRVAVNKLPLVAVDFSMRLRKRDARAICLLTTRYERF